MQSILLYSGGPSGLSTTYMAFDNILVSGIGPSFGVGDNDCWSFGSPKLWSPALFTGLGDYNGDGYDDFVFGSGGPCVFLGNAAGIPNGPQPMFFMNEYFAIVGAVGFFTPNGYN